MDREPDDQDLKRPFKIAREEGLIDRNPVAAVRPAFLIIRQFAGADPHREQQACAKLPINIEMWI